MKLINVKWTNKQSYSQCFINADEVLFITREKVFLKDKSTIDFGKDFKIVDINYVNGKTIWKEEGMDFINKWEDWDKNEEKAEKGDMLMERGKKMIDAINSMKLGNYDGLNKKNQEEIKKYINTRNKTRLKEIQTRARINEQIKLNNDFAIKNKIWRDDSQEWYAFYDPLVQKYKELGIEDPSSEARLTIMRMIDNNINYIESGKTNWNKNFKEKENVN